MAATFAQALSNIRRGNGGPGASPNAPRTSKLGVSEMLAMRGRGGPDMSLVTDAKTHQRLTNDEATARSPRGGYQINIPSSTGFEGSRHGGSERHPTHGYSFENQGGAGDYVRRNGGISPKMPSLLNDLYLNQPGRTMGAYDQLQSQKAMDEADPAAGYMADQAGVAGARGNDAKAAFYQGMLDDYLARQQASGTGGTTGAGSDAGTANGAGDVAGIPEDTYHYPGEKRTDAGGNVWQWDEQSGRGNLIQRAPTVVEGLQMRHAAQQPSTNWEAGNNLGEGILHTQYGDASVAQANAPTNAAPGATFDNAQGSSLGGVQFQRPGRQTAEDFFQDAANRQGQENKYAAPAPGYGGVKDNPQNWGRYESAMKAKNRLKMG